jgi:hypothetical protein
MDFSLDLLSANSDVLRLLVSRCLRVYLTFVVVILGLFVVGKLLLTCGKGLVEGHGCLNKTEIFQL